MSFPCNCCCTTSIVLGITAFLALLKLYIKFTTGVYNGNERLDGKIAIVTGATTGIGLEAAKDFARRGARVVMLCRDMVKGNREMKTMIQETGNNKITVQKIDFSSLLSVRTCAKELLEEVSRIDILLNNAGAANTDSIKLTEDGMETLMQTNHFGPFLFTNILLGRIKKSSPSRIVNVSSSGHKIARLDLEKLDMSNTSIQLIVYANTKLANIFFTNELAGKLQGTGVTVNSLHPGVVKTDLFRNASQWFKILSKFSNLFFKDVVEGAQTSIYLCVSPDVEKVTGKYFEDCKEASTHKKAQDLEQARKLWQLSEKAVGLLPTEKHY